MIRAQFDLILCLKAMGDDRPQDRIDDWNTAMKKLMHAALAATILLASTGLASAQPYQGQPYRGQQEQRYEQRPDGRYEPRPDGRFIQRDGRYVEQQREEHRYREVEEHEGWRRGQAIRHEDWDRGRRVDYREYQLREPPRGYEWREVNGAFVLGAIATGVIASILLNAR